MALNRISMRNANAPYLNRGTTTFNVSGMEPTRTLLNQSSIFFHFEYNLPA